MVTIKEIARKLGVSPTTVSNVLHGKTQRMSPDTRKKIEEALRDHHYFREDAVNDHVMPAVVVAFDAWDKENIVSDPFFGEVLGAIERELRKYGRSVVFSVQNNENELKRLLAGYNVEGGILVAYRPKMCETMNRISAKPLVFIDCGDGDYCNVGLQDVEGAQEITAYLLKLGHEKIAFFSDQEYPSLGANAKRLRGFRAALEKYGRSFQKEDYVYLPEERYIRQETLRQFAKKKAGKEYTAAFFVSDLLANEAINIFRSQDISVPDDISVTGFDDNIYAKLSMPTITTVRQSPAAKGREAVKLLLMLLKGDENVPGSLELPTELIVRESVGNRIK